MDEYISLISKYNKLRTIEKSWYLKIQHLRHTSNTIDIYKKNRS